MKYNQYTLTHIYFLSTTPQPNNSSTHNYIILEKLGYGPFQRRILIAAGLCFASDSMEVLLLSFLAVVLQAEWGLTDNQTDTITSSVFVGAMLGTLTLGPLGDKVGRKPVFTATAAIISLFGFLTAATNNYSSLLVIRFLVGFGVGGLTVPFDTLAEFVPTSARGQNLMAIEYFWTGGTLLVPILAYITLGKMGEIAGDNAWRYFVALCAIPCVVSTVLGILFVPESPRWLVAEGRQEKALRILRQAAAHNNKDPYQVFPEGTLIKDDDGASEESSNFMDLLKPQWFKLNLKLWFLWAAFAYLYYGVILLVTLVFAGLDENEQTATLRSHRHPQHHQPTTGEMYSFDYSAIFTSASAEVAGTTIILLVIDRIGRVRSQVYSYLGGGICVALLCHSANQDNPTRSHLVMLAFLSRMFFMGASCGAWVSTAELLSTEIRTTGHAASNAVARLSGAFCPYLVNATTSYPTIGTVMFLMSMAACNVVGKLPETTGKAMGQALHHEHADDSDDDDNSNDGVGGDGMETKKLLA